MSNVLDISHYQTITSMAEIKAGGIPAIILKCTQGLTYLDPTFAPRYGDAIGSGMAVSSYHFLDHGKDPSAQMDWYLKNLHPRQGERVCIDYEDEGSTLDELKKAVQRILDLRPDLQITVYSGHLIKEQLGSKRDALLAENTSLWIAQYTTAKSPSWPTATWPSWSLWQFTDKAAAKGIKGNVDTNRFNGSDESLMKWFGPADSVAPTPIPEPIPVQQKKLATIQLAFDVEYTVEVSENLPAGTVNVRIGPKP